MRAHALLAVLVLAPLSNALAQGPLEPRARPPSSIAIQSGLMLPLASVTRLDPSPVVPSQAGNAVWTGVKIGAGVGAGVGAVTGLVMMLIGTECDLGGCPDDWTDEQRASAGAIILFPTVAGAVVGFLVGGIVGIASGSDSQADAPPDRLRLSFVPQRDARFALGVSVSF